MCTSLSPKVVQILLYIATAITLVVGTLLVAVGSQYIVNTDIYKPLILNVSGTQSLAGQIVAVGVILILTSFFGFFAAFKINKHMLIAYTATLLILIITQVAIGVHGGNRTYDTEFQSNIINNSYVLFKQYKDDIFVRIYFFTLETTLRCCGIRSKDDYTFEEVGISRIPGGCCGRILLETCAGRFPHSTGCGIEVAQRITRAINALAFWPLQASAAQVPAVIFATYLARITNKESNS